MCGQANRARRCRLRPAILLAATLLFLHSAGCTGEKEPPRARAPRNIVFIVVDALRADRLGAYGYRRPATPNIDRLAARSIVMERAYTPSPWTKPAVASLMTSLHPKDHGVRQWDDVLDDRFLTLAEYLVSRGYYTEGHGTHIILGPRYRLTRGFRRFSLDPIIEKDPHKIATSEEVTKLALEALSRPMPEPFFLFLHYFDPHDEYLSHEGFDFGTADADRYDSEVAYTDYHIGRLLSALEARGMTDRTVIGVTADHGEEFGDHGGYRHTKTLYEEVLRIPLIMYSPGEAARRDGSIASIMDVAPTLVRLAGLPVPEPFRGRVLDVASGGLGTPEAAVFAETVRRADKRAIVTEEWKLIHDREEERWELYNLAADPGEQDDRRGKDPEVFERQRIILENFYRTPSFEAETEELAPEMREKLKSMGYL